MTSKPPRNEERDYKAITNPHTNDTLHYRRYPPSHPIGVLQRLKGEPIVAQEPHYDDVTTDAFDSNYDSEYYAEYEAGIADGEEAGRKAYESGEDTTKADDPNRTPYKDGYDDGFYTGWNLARKQATAL